MSNTKTREIIIGAINKSPSEVESSFSALIKSGIVDRIEAKRSEVGANILQQIKVDEKSRFSVSDDPKKMGEDELLDFMEFLENAKRTGDKNNKDAVKDKIKVTEKEIKKRGFE